jgi:hypothetical protein
MEVGTTIVQIIDNSKKKKETYLLKNTSDFRNNKTDKKTGGQGLRSSRTKCKRRRYWIKDLARGNYNLQKKKITKHR